MQTAAVVENVCHHGQCWPTFSASCGLTFDCRVRVSHLAAVASSADCTLNLLTSLQLLQKLLGQRAGPHSKQPLQQWTVAPHLPRAVALSQFGLRHPASFEPLMLCCACWRLWCQSFVGKKKEKTTPFSVNLYHFNEKPSTKLGCPGLLDRLDDAELGTGFI